MTMHQYSAHRLYWPSMVIVLWCGVMQASAEELVLHEQQLADIDKASKVGCVWKALEQA